nr:MAG TPA: hypothetical protein [Caudoviricetes sp.]
MHLTYFFLLDQDSLMLLVSSHLYLDFAVTKVFYYNIRVAF